MDYSLYEGHQGLGEVTLTMQRGEMIFAEGELRARPGQGDFLAAKRHS